MSLSVENKSLPPIAKILSIKAQTFDDFSFREPVVRFILIFSRNLRDLFFKHQQKTYIVWPLCVPRNVTFGN